MIKHFLLFAGLLFSIQVMAQTGIGTPTPNASAKLDVSSSTMGFLPPRVTLTAANTFSPIVGTPSAAIGLLVYNLGSVGLKAGYYYWNGSNWATIATASSPDQTVDYVSVGTIYQTSVGVNIDLIFTTNNGGNIPYNTTTGIFTLSANKTYLFQAQVRTNTPSANASHIDYGFVDANTNALLVNGTSTITTSTTATAGYGSNPVINFIYTPTTNQTVKLRTIGSDGTQAVVSGTANITQIGSSAIINPWTLSGTNTFNTTGNVGIGTSTPTEKLEVSGNVKATNFIGNGSQLSNVLTKVKDSWVLATGLNNVSFPLPTGGTYAMWVYGNIPNGIVIWNATVTTANTNVPVVGSQYGWYYSVGNALVLNSIPDQIIGTNNGITTSPGSYAPNTSNIFKFGITNNSGVNQTIYWGYTRLD